MRWIAFMAVAVLAVVLFPQTWWAVGLIVFVELVALAFEKLEAR